MTFSIVARDTSGAFGMAVSSSSPAVAARCVHLRDGVGAASSQNITDPRLGTRLLDALASGLGAEQALAGLTASEPTAEYRQLVVVDAAGGVAVHSGARTLGIHGEATGFSVAAAGNMLSTDQVPAAMVAAFEASEGELEERLVTALRAGLTAGGEAGPVYSAGLSVVRSAGWRETDLRVDWTENPIDALEALLEVWMPQRNNYVTRGLDPASSPAYGVPGDE